MFKDVTLGQYYPVDSPIHRLDPRVKLLALVIYLASLFICDTFIIFVPATIFLIMCGVLSKVPFGIILKSIKPILPLIIISAAFNIFMTPGSVLCGWWIFNITDRGIYVAAFMACRLVYLIAGSAFLTLTTSPNSITDGLESGIGFLKYIKVPVHEIAMMMSIALRFIPILSDEMQKIRKAQMARGADFESGNLIKRAKALIPLLVPLFVSAFMRANELSLAMDARCYRGAEGRTKMKPLKHKAADYVSYVILLAYLAIVILLRIFLPIW